MSFVGRVMDAISYFKQLDEGDNITITVDFIIYRDELIERVEKSINILKELRLLTPMEYGREEQIDLLLGTFTGITVMCLLQINRKD